MILDHSTETLAAACDVSPAAIGRVFDAYANATPAATLVGAGLQRYAHGGETVRLINALAMVSGNVGRQGGGSYFHLHSYRNLDLSWTKDEQRKRHRSFRLPVVGREILESDNPPVNMIWVNNTNIVNQAADSQVIAHAFDKTPFTVVVDAFFTDTAESADLILPSTLMLEQEDIIGSFLHEYVHHAQVVSPPPGETKDDYTILLELGKRLAPPILLPEPEQCLKTSLRSPFLDVSIDALRDGRYVRARRPAVPYEDMRFDHFDGKYRFPIVLHPEPQPPTDYPLRLLSLVRRSGMHSQILSEDQKSLPRAWVAPDCPAWKQLDPDKDVYIVSFGGRLRVRLGSIEGLHPQTVLYRRGDWMKHGGGVNQLIEARLTDMGSGAAFYDQFVRLENA
jgi:anaerobic selenocysteine-containing dehydrogenase